MLKPDRIMGLKIKKVACIDDPGTQHMLNLMTFGLGATKFAVPALQGKTISDFYAGHTHITDNFLKNRNLGLNHAKCRAVHADIPQH